MTCAIRAEYDQVCDINISRLWRLGYERNLWFPERVGASFCCRNVLP
jgi:hypothetical protein